MHTRPLGSLQVSVVGLGTNNFGKRMADDAVSSVVNACLDSGINFFDTADVYGGTRSEELLGAAVIGRRQEAIIATKFGIPIDDQRKGGCQPCLHSAGRRG